MSTAIAFFIGASCGFTAATIYYRWNRLIRIEQELDSYNTAKERIKGISGLTV